MLGTIARTFPIVRNSLCPRAYGMYPIRMYCAPKQSSSFMGTFHKVVDKYEEFLKNNFPRIYVLHMRISNGGKSCLADVKTYWGVIRLLRNGATLDSLDTRQLQVLVLFPAEGLKIISMLILLEIPIIGEMLILSIVLFPRIVLTRHFWTDEQIVQFTECTLNSRRKRHYGPLAEAFRTYLQENKIGVEGAFFNSPKSLEELSTCSSREIKLETIPLLHRYHLCRSHGVLPIWGWKRRIERRCVALKILEDRLNTDASLLHLNDLSLHQALFMRQFSSKTLNREERVQLLKKWIEFDKNATVSFSLHVPALLKS